MKKGFLSGRVKSNGTVGDGEETNNTSRAIWGLAPRSKFAPPETDVVAASVLATTSTMATAKGLDSIACIIAAISKPDGKGVGAAVGDLCIELRAGGWPAIELACELGATELTVALINPTRNSSHEDAVMAKHATEALWWLASDYDQAQLLIQKNGHDTLLRLAKEAGSQDAAVARSCFRLLAQTLYYEQRTSKLWHNADIGFITEALVWALQNETTEAVDNSSILAFVCDVATLVVNRCRAADKDSARVMVGIIPMLLEKMAAHCDDAPFLQHGCRLLYALASSCDRWPEDMRAPAMAALSAISEFVSRSEDFQVRGYGHLALKAVAALPQVSLSQMD